MIFTSNYSRQGQNPLSVSISRRPPDYYTGSQLEMLAPTWDMVIARKQKRMGEEEFISLYIALLKKRKIDPHKIIDLPDGTMLLCYESPKDFCHRHILAQWIENETGVLIPEWKNEKETKTEAQNKLVDSLFDL